MNREESTRKARALGAAYRADISQMTDREVLREIVREFSAISWAANERLALP
jgi:hypothetical protein